MVHHTLMQNMLTIQTSENAKREKKKKNQNGLFISWLLAAGQDHKAFQLSASCNHLLSSDMIEESLNT